MKWRRQCSAGTRWANTHLKVMWCNAQFSPELTKHYGFTWWGFSDCRRVNKYYFTHRMHKTKKRKKFVYTSRQCAMCVPFICFFSGCLAIFAKNAFKQDIWSWFAQTWCRDGSDMSLLCYVISAAMVSDTRRYASHAIINIIKWVPIVAFPSHCTVCYHIFIIVVVIALSQPAAAFIHHLRHRPIHLIHWWAGGFIYCRWCLMLLRELCANRRHDMTLNNCFYDHILLLFALVFFLVRANWFQFHCITVCRYSVRFQ